MGGQENFGLFPLFGTFFYSEASFINQTRLLPPPLRKQILLGKGRRAKTWILYIRFSQWLLNYDYRGAITKSCPHIIQSHLRVSTFYLLKLLMDIDTTIC